MMWLQVIGFVALVGLVCTSLFCLVVNFLAACESIYNIEALLEKLVKKEDGL